MCNKKVAVSSVKMYLTDFLLSEHERKNYEKSHSYYGIDRRHRVRNGQDVGLAGHNVLLHGHNPAKLEEVEKTLSALPDGGRIEIYVSDLSRMADVEALAKAVAERYVKLDVLINNAGVYRSAELVTQDGLDTRFAVNTIAPYLLTQQLIPLLGASGRVINLSSAAQSPVDLEALVGRVKLTDGAAYAQSKLALTMWSRNMALSLKDEGPAIIAVNPRSMLGSKMVKEAYGVVGGDLRIGAEILCRAALSEDSRLLPASILTMIPLPSLARLFQENPY